MLFFPSKPAGDTEECGLGEGTAREADEWADLAESAQCVREGLGEEGCRQRAGDIADGRNLGTIPTDKMAQLDPKCPGGLESRSKSRRYSLTEIKETILSAPGQQAEGISCLRGSS